MLFRGKIRLYHELLVDAKDLEEAICYVYDIGVIQIGEIMVYPDVTVVIAEEDDKAISPGVWAIAIVERICDEWSGKDNEEDFILLKEVLTKALINSPEECKRLVGTTIIEESYFDKIKE